MAISDRTGMDGAQFLRLGAGARAAALGEAFTAVTEGSESLYWNPGGLARVSVSTLTLSHAEYLGLFRYETIYGAVPSARLKGTLGLGMSYLAQDSIKAFDKTGAATGESFRPSSISLSAGYARRFRLDGMIIGAGAGVSWLRETLWTETASAYALDLGVQASHDNFKGWRAGAALRHFGSRQKFISKPSPLPTELDLGLAYEPGGGRNGWTFSAEAAVPYYADLQGKFGIERRMELGAETMLAMRGGFNTRTLSSLGAMSTLSFGCGLYFKRMSWDISFNNQGDLGSIYRFGLGWRFGGNSRGREEKQTIQEEQKQAEPPPTEPLPTEPLPTEQPPTEPPPTELLPTEQPPREPTPVHVELPGNTPETVKPAEKIADPVPAAE